MLYPSISIRRRPTVVPEGEEGPGKKGQTLMSAILAWRGHNRETAERYQWVVHAYVIMRNHFHLAVETPEPNLSVGMKFLQGTWGSAKGSNPNGA